MVSQKRYITILVPVTVSESTIMRWKFFYETLVYVMNLRESYLYPSKVM